MSEMPELQFIEYLERRTGDEGNGRAVLAALRRGLGKTPGQASEMHPHLVPFTSSLLLRDEETYYLIASLFAFHHRRDQRVWPSDARRRSFGASLALLATSEATARGSTGPSPSLERRVVALLAARHEDLPEHLRYAVALFRTSDVPVDWSELLRHIRAWQHEDRWVQRRWARDFWRAPAVEQNDTNAA